MTGYITGEEHCLKHTHENLHTEFSAVTRNGQINLSLFTSEAATEYYVDRTCTAKEVMSGVHGLALETHHNSQASTHKLLSLSHLGPY